MGRSMGLPGGDPGQGEGPQRAAMNVPAVCIPGRQQASP